jgi:hypothetical protein
VQRLALQSLAHLKTSELVPQLQTILALTEAKSLRKNLTRLDLQLGGAILPGDRAVLVPVVTRVLFPHMRKRSARLGGLGGAGSARAAILNKLGCLEAGELVTLAALFLEPLAASAGWEEGWEEGLLAGGPQEWLSRASAVGVALAAPSRRQATINAISDLQQHLVFRMLPLLPGLAAATLALFETAAEASECMLRSQALRVLTEMLDRFAEEMDWRPYWPRLLAAATPLAAQPLSDASGGVPPLLMLVRAAASSPAHLPVLAGCPHLQELPSVVVPPVDARGPELLRAAVGTLGTSASSAAARDAVLCTLESILDSGSAAVDCVLQPVVDELVKALHLHVLEAGAGPRDVVLLHRICSLVQDDASAEALAAALVATAARRRRSSALTAQTLRTLAGLWQRQCCDAAAAALAAESAALSLAPLAARRSGAVLRTALADALTAAASRAPTLMAAAATLRASAAAAAAADGTDSSDAGNEALDAYCSLTTEAWAAQLPTSTMVLVHTVVHDAGAKEDLALRSAAAGALTRLIDAAASHPRLQAIATTTFYRLLLASLSTNTTATVRCEFLSLAQRLAQRLPGSFPDLATLTHADPEVDFFFNVCHIQLHRRTRALQRLRVLLNDPEVGNLAPTITDALSHRKAVYWTSKRCRARVSKLLS